MLEWEMPLLLQATGIPFKNLQPCWPDDAGKQISFPGGSDTQSLFLNGVSIALELLLVALPALCTGLADRQGSKCRFFKAPKTKESS